MDGASLTAEYLSRVTASGAKAGELIGRLPESQMLNAFYKGTYLSRPGVPRPCRAGKGVQRRVDCARGVDQPAGPAVRR